MSCVHLCRKKASIPTAAACRAGSSCSSQRAAGAQHALLALYLSLSRRAAALMPLLGSFLICMSLGSSGFTMLARTLSCRQGMELMSSSAADSRLLIADEASGKHKPGAAPHNELVHLLLDNATNDGE